MFTLLRIKKIKTILIIKHLLVGLCLITASNAYASSTEIVITANATHLEVSPKKCIALRKGQKCYLEVVFSWQHTKISDYCLVNITTNEIMKCWLQQSKGEFSFDFQSTLTNDFALRFQDSASDLASARIPVAWVYKSSKRAKSTWRLF